MTVPGGAQPEVVLRLRRICKAFGDLVANDDISLDLRRGEIVALLGENGAGKTTLMNILFGHYQADSGSLEVDGATLAEHTPRDALAHGIGMVHQHFTLADNLSALDNIVLGTEPVWRWRQQRAAARARLAALMDRLDLRVEPDRKVGDLSVGEKQRVEILKALFRDARILVLDEPTAVLTPQEAAGLFGTLRQLAAEGLSVLFISHKLDEVLEIADRMVVLRRGRVVGELARGRADKATLAELMVGHALHLPERADAEHGAPRLQLDRVDLDGPHGRPLLSGLDLQVCAGEIVGIAGVSGNGQAALADVIAGLAVPDAGRVRIDGADAPLGDPRAMVRLGVARIPEDRLAEGVIGDMQVWENAVAERYDTPAFSRWGVQRGAEGRRVARDLIARYDVRCPGERVPTKLLSGGNIQKVILGRCLEAEPHVVLANQPTRGLDIGAVSFVQERLNAAKRRGAAILLISEDLEEIRALADRVYVMTDGHLTHAGDPQALSTVALGLMMTAAR